MDPFVHLHVHSEYSLLDGLSSCEELAARAVELGMPAIALTDHGVMFGAIQFYKACQEAGVKPIIGMETYLAPGNRGDRDAQRARQSSHLELLAQNNTGYQNLLCLATIAQLEGFYYRPRIDKEALLQHSEGLIVLSGCGSSEVARLILAGQLSEARRVVAWYRDAFPGRYFLEIQEHDIAELVQVNAQLIGLARELNVPLVATNDAHYALRQQASIHDVLLCIQTGKTVTEPKRMRMDGDSYYLRSAEEMRALFPEVPEALTNTLRIAEMCEVELQFGTYHLPPFAVPEGENAQSYLRSLCEVGLRQRYGAQAPAHQARLDYELDTIHRMGFDTYFLIVWDLCRFAREAGIWWNVRGSASSSIVAYSLGVTSLNPLEYGQVFERFLNLGRVTMPDIDLDFPDDQRADLIRYTVGKYGQEQVAQIVTFGTMGAKAAIRDVGRALDYPLPDVDRIARLVPGGPKVTLGGALEDVTELKQLYESEEHIRRLIDTARGVEGNIRHASTHAAGVIVSDVPLVRYVPLHRPTSGDGGEIGTVTQYTMEELEELGLLKIDFLGLSTLTVMRRACKLIHERHGNHLDLYNIPVDDPLAFGLLSRGDVMGIFQVEGQGMRRVLMSMQPSQFEHIMATISLFRPGPMEYIEPYIDCLHGKKAAEYRHPSLEPILRETFGIIVYQEQIIRILTDIAGYSASDADLVRRAVGKKKKAELLSHRESFVEGAVQRSGLPAETAGGIFEDIEYFARYGFNTSHAANYAVLTCQTAYLKAKYPVEYMAALLSVERNNTEKVGQLIAECRRMGIGVLPPDVNRSGLDFTIEEEASGTPAIRFGLGAVKNVGEGPVGAILEARQVTCLFEDLDDFCRRVDLRQVNRRALESLIKAGALRAFGTRSRLLENAERLVGLSTSLHRARDVGQMSLFGSASGMAPGGAGARQPVADDAAEVSQREILSWEKELVGVYISEHPLERALRDLADVVSGSIGGLREERNGQQVILAGMVQRVRRHSTKKGDEMAFVTLEDLDGACDVIVFPKVWGKTEELWEPESIVVVSGKVDARRQEAPSVLCDWVKPPSEVLLPAKGSNGPSITNSAPTAAREAPLQPQVQPRPVVAPARRSDPPASPNTRPATLPGPRMVLVTLTRTGEQTRDVQLLRNVHNLLVEHHGLDSFVIQIVGGAARPVELAFPNDRTGYSPELARDLAAIAGAGSVRVESVQ